MTQQSVISAVVSRKMELLSTLMAARSLKDQRERNKAQRLESVEASREKCKTFKGFITESWHICEPVAPFIHNWHNDAIADHLEAVHRGEIRRLQINQPPGTMKSLTASVMFPAWEWTTDAWIRYLTTSYKETYAIRDSRRHRDIVASDWYRERWPNTRLERDGENDFTTTMKGGRLAVAMASLTAGRGNVEIIDDPHSTEQAESAADREKTTRIFRESAPSRLNDPLKDKIIVIMHRLHEADVCGVIEELDLPYTKLILPMEFQRSLTVTTPFFKDPRTEEGELLCPQRLPAAEIKVKKIEHGEHAWATQYQQLPRARSGAYYFNRSHLLDSLGVIDGVEQYGPSPLPKFIDAVFSITDTASKVGKNRDGTGTVWFGYTTIPQPKAWVLDWELKQMDADLITEDLPNWIARGTELATQYKARSGFIGCWVEDANTGIVVIKHGERNGLPVHALDTKLTAMGKDGRATSASGYINKGWLKMSEPAFNKTVEYKGRNRNHFFHQMTHFRVGLGTENDEDEMFDCGCYGAIIAFGDTDGF